MSVKFIIDSASDVLPEEAARLGVTHLPMKVVFGTEEYADSVDLSHGEFFDKLAHAKQLPTTCQIPPAEFGQACKTLVDQGHQVIIITISSALSGTYQSAVIAAGEYEGRVFVVDSRSATIGERILLQRGLELAQQGMGAAAITRVLEEEKQHIRLVAVLDTLDYLKKGGRISTATALAGSLLAIKPAVEIKGGQVVMAGTARGTKKANQLLKDLILGYRMDRQKPVALAWAGTDELLNRFLEETPSLWEGVESMSTHSLGCTIGTHIGPGAYGVAFFEK